MTDPIGRLLGETPWSVDTRSVVLRIVLSVILSAVIGCERASKRHSAGLRTFILISLASTVAMILDTSVAMMMPEHFLPLLSSSAIIGIAIICVHSLYISSKTQIKGLTTATGLWTCGIIGLTLGAGLYVLSLTAFVVLLCCLFFFPYAERYLKNRSNHFEIHLELKDSSFLQNFVSTIRRLGMTIDDIEANPAYTGSGLSVYSIAISISGEELKKYKTHKEIIEALRTLDYIYHVEEMLS